MKLTEHFDIEADRLWCRCHRHVGEERGVHAFSIHSLGLLQELRYRWGRPIPVESAMRCWDRHVEVCKAAGQPVTNASGHVWTPERQVCAFDLDVTPETGMELARLAVQVGFRGIGLGRTKLHVDTLPRKSFWFYRANGSIVYALQ